MESHVKAVFVWSEGVRKRTKDNLPKLSPTCRVQISLSPFHAALYFFLSQGGGEEVGKVSARDFDSGRNGEVAYELLYAVDVNSKFEVNPTTGSISTLAKLDYEQIRQHILYIGASDKGVPSLSSKLNQTQVD